MLQGFLISLALLVVAVFAGRRIGRGGRRFVIEIEDGVPRLVSGTAPRGFVDEVASICGFFNVRKGRIEAFGSPPSIRLVCHGDAEDRAQAFRNVLANARIR